MVTTRSADKRLANASKIEDLALRSRSVDVVSFSTEAQHLNTPTPGPASTRKRSNISIDVPPAPEKRQKMNSDAEENDDDSPYFTAKESPGSFGMIATRSENEAAQSTNMDEIADSQGSNSIKDDYAQREDLIAHAGAVMTDPINETHDNSNLLGSQAGPGEKHGHNLATPSTNHVRFDVEEPGDTDRSPEIAVRSSANNDSFAGNQSDEEAPEVSTIEFSRTPKQSRRSIRGPKRMKATSNQNSEASYQNETAVVADNISKALPLRATDTTDRNAVVSDQDKKGVGNGGIYLAEAFPSSASEHQQFNENQIHETEHANKFNNTVILKNRDITPVTKLASNLTTLRIDRASNTSIAPPERLSLPARPTNSLEKYRRNRLKAQVDAGKVKLQKEWPSKRTHFVSDRFGTAAG